MRDNGWQPCTRPNLWAFQLLSVQNRHAQRGGLQKKKGHLLIRSGFRVIHRPRNAKISAIPQVLTFFFGDHPFGFAGFSIKKSGQALKKQDVW